MNSISNKQKVIGGISIVLVFIIIIAYSNKFYQMWESHVVGDVCTTYYKQVSQGPFKAIGAYDSDGNGFGACNIYNNTGTRIDSLECDNSYFFNSGVCKAVKMGFIGGEQ